ncbi:MAG TPA: transglycosylase SLT domain-containing protein [Micromonosporaceae bacterium]
MSLADVFVRVRPKVDANTAELEAEGHEIGRKVGNAAGRQFKDEFSNSIREEVFTRLAASISLLGSKWVALGAAAVTASPQILGLASALTEVAGIAVAAPAAFVGAAAAGGVLALAFHGVGKAISAVASGDPKKIANAFKELTPEAQNLAKEIGGLNPQFERLQRTVQQHVFAGFNVQIAALASLWFPLLTAHLPHVADGINRFALGLGTAARNGALVQGVSTVLDATGVSIGRASTGVIYLAHAFGVLLSAGAPVVAALGTGFTALAQRFDAFIIRAQSTGQLTVWLNNAIRVLRDLGNLVLNVGSIIGSIFGVANVYGHTFLTTLVNLTGQAAAFLRSTQGVEVLKTVFAALNVAGGLFFSVLRQLWPVLVQLLLAVSPLVPVVRNLITTLATGLTQVISALLPSIRQFAVILAANLQPLMPVLAKAFRDLAPVLGQVAATFVHMAAQVLPIVVAIIKALVPILVTLATTLLPIAPYVLAAVTAFRLASAVIGVVRVAWLALSLAFTVSPLGLVIALLGLLVGALIYAWTHFQGFRNVVEAAWHGIQAAASFAWNNVLSPVFNAIRAFIVGVVAPAFVWLWHNVIEPVWNGIQAAIGAYWNYYILPIFRAVKWFIENLVAPAFTWLWHNVIEPVWHGIQSTIDWVWNRGIRPVLDFMIRFITRDVPNAWNAGANAVGAAWARVQNLAKTPVNWVIRYVINDGIINAWNAVAGVFPGAPHLGAVHEIGAGAVAPVFHGLASGGVLDGYEPGRDTIPAMLSKGEGVAVPELVRQIGKDRFLAWNAAARRGEPITGFASGGIVGAIGGAIGDILGIFTSPAKWLLGKVGGAINGIAGAFGNGDFVKLLTAIPRKMVSVIADFVTHSLGSMFAGGGAPSGALAQWIAAAVALTGVGPSWIGPLSVLIGRESGGNPRAINLWDANARAGHPSMGLMQTIGPTFAAYRDPRLPNDPFNPVANIVAGINYIRARYGSIFAVQQANPNLPPRGYDNGGPLMPGWSSVYNGTGKPENVTTHDTMRDVVRLLAAIHAAIEQGHDITVKVGERELAHAVTAAQRRVEWEG